MNRKLIAALFLFSACDSVPARNESTKSIPPIATFVERFATSHPEWLQNEIIEERTNSAFRDSLIAFYKGGNALQSIPFRLTEIVNADNSQYAAFCIPAKSLEIGTRNINLEVALLISEAQIGGLQKGNLYQLAGSFVRMTQAEVFTARSSGVHFQSIEFAPHRDSTYYLGLPLFKADRITPAH